MGWTKALAADTLGPDSRQVVAVGDRKVLLINQGGDIYAVGNKCPHLNLSMKKGKIKDCQIVCPWHRSVFDLKTGEPQEWTPWPPVVGKAMSAISQPKALPVFQTKVEDGHIWVEV